MFAYQNHMQPSPEPHVFFPLKMDPALGGGKLRMVAASSSRAWRLQ